MHDNSAIYRERVLGNIGHTLGSTDLFLPGKRVGKVRDSYRLGKDRLVVITTDRQSAFDRVLANIPFKGAVLNLVSAWWFARTRHITANHLVAVPHPNVSIVTACEVFPVEFVVRGYITGTTQTSLWTHYADGERTYCGNTLPDGLRKNQQLGQPILTPTTKETDHDRPISPLEIVEKGWMDERDWLTVSNLALRLFAFGQQQASRNGLILVDTKYEFGRSSDGTVMLVDEVHTPDSSRYWIASTYRERMDKGEEPENIDKEFLRLWFRSVCDPYRDPVLPKAPDDLVAELSLRYIRLYEMITGESFPFDRLTGEGKSMYDSIEEAVGKITAEMDGEEMV